MLPFLGRQKTQSILIAHKKPGKPMDILSEPQEHPLASAAEDLIHAIHLQNVEEVAKALEAAFQLYELTQGETDETFGHGL